MDIIDQAFILWEKQNQPRRASARTVACSNGVDCLGQGAHEEETDKDRDED